VKEVVTVTHQNPAQAPTRLTRLTRSDIEVINGALALLEADVEGEEPDPTRDGDEEYDGWVEDHTAWQSRLDDVRAVRDKIHARRR
jgi:hypothetical protein